MKRKRLFALGCIIACSACIVFLAYFAHFRILDYVRYYWSSFTPSYSCYLGDGTVHCSSVTSVPTSAANVIILPHTISSIIVPALSYNERRFEPFQKYATPVLGAVPHRNLSRAHALYVYMLEDVTAFRASTYTASTVFHHLYGCNEEINDIYPAHVREIECAIQLSDRWTDNYSHMMNEGLTRLLLVDSDIFRECHVIVPRHPYDGHHNRQLLALMLGVPLARILESNPPVRVKRMFVPEAWECCACNPRLMQTLWNVARGVCAVNTSDVDGPLWRAYEGDTSHGVDGNARDLVYLTRSQSKSQNARGITNEGAILQALSDFAAAHALRFIIYDPVEHTLEYTRGVMSSTRVIVGMHGAALANMIFAPKHTVVLEFAAKYIAMHANQAFALDMQYFVVETRPQPQNALDDFYVDADGMMNVLHNLVL